MVAVDTENIQSWDDVKGESRGNFTPLEAGVYTAYLFGWEKKVSQSEKNRGKDYYQPEFVIDQEGAPKAHVWGYWDTRGARGYMKKDFDSLGISLTGVSLDDIAELESRMDDAVTSQLPCRLRLKKVSYKGMIEDPETGEEVEGLKWKNEIAAILPPR